MIRSEGVHITDIEEIYPDPSTLSVEQLEQNQENLPIDGRIYQAPFGLSVDGGIEELEERLSLEALVSRAMRTGLTFEERQVLGLKSGINGRGPHTVREIAGKMSLSPNQVNQLRITAGKIITMRLYSSVYDVIDKGAPIRFPLSRKSNEE